MENQDTVETTGFFAVSFVDSFTSLHMHASPCQSWLHLRVWWVMLWTKSLMAPFLPQVSRVDGWKAERKYGSGMGALLSGCRFDQLPRGVPPGKSGCQPRWLCDCGVPGVTLKGAKRQPSCLLLHEQGARSKLAVPSIWLPWNPLISWAKRLASPTTPLPRSCLFKSVWGCVRISPVSHLVISDYWLEECFDPINSERADRRGNG